MKRLYARASLAVLVTTVVIAAGCNDAVLSLDDVITQPGGKARLVAYAEREPVLGLRSDVEGIRVTFFAGENELGDDKTNDEGIASNKCDPFPRGEPLARAVAHIDGETLTALGRVFEWSEKKIGIAVDIDNTISRTDYDDLVLEERDEDSHPIKSARRALRRLSEDFQILYLTARPRFLLDKTREWLEENEFPPGPLVVAPGLRQAIHPEAFKRDALKHYRKDWPNILIGIGDKPSDAKAYGENDMLALIVTKEDARSYGPHAVCFEKWKRLAEFFEANRDRLLDPDYLEDTIDGKAMIERTIPPYDD
jgi:hypothetical protein